MEVNKPWWGMNSALHSMKTSYRHNYQRELNDNFLDDNVNTLTVIRL